MRSSLSRSNPQPSDVSAYLDVLAHLRAIHWLSWTAHWKSKGPNAYGMHLLLERLYTGKPGPDIEEQIDELGERIIAYFGNDSVDGVKINKAMTSVLESVASRGGDDVCQLLCLERKTQNVIKIAWGAEQLSGIHKSLGLDDLLMGIAKDRETAIYLLQQTWR